MEKDAAAIEAELNESEMKMSVTLWRKISRYDPDKDNVANAKKEPSVTSAKQDQPEVKEERERTRPESKTERKRRLRQERQERQRLQREQSAAIQPQWSAADDVEMEEQPGDGQQQPSQSAAALYELGVPRLRDLITDRSTVVQFSFAFDSSTSAADAGDSSTAAAEAGSDVAMNVYAPAPEAFPTRPAPVAVQPPAAVQPIAGAAAGKRGSTLHSLLKQRNVPDRPVPQAPISEQAGGGKGRLSDILALAQQAHNGERAGNKATSAAAAVSSDEDDDLGLFMRSTAEGEVESEWRRHRANVREDYKKKNKSAVRQESNKQSKGGASLPWAKSKRKASAEQEDGGRKNKSAAF